MNDKVTLFGEVVAVDGEGVQVRLDSDELAVLRDAHAVEVGYRGEFVVEGQSPDGRTLVSPLLRAGAEEHAAAFDLEFDRLQSALSGRRPAPRVRAASPTSRTTQEEEIRGWVRRVDNALAVLRKHRAKRLSEQVHDES